MSITDGTYFCGRCGDDRSVCWLCVGMEPALIKRVERNTYEDERELDRQSASIKRAAAIRRGEI